MRYGEQITAAFDRLGFKPRGRQAEDIDLVLRAFLDDGIKVVTLQAPTGTGKSIIGAVVAEVLHSVKHPGQEAGASFLLTPLNVLAKQYHETFQDGRDPEDTRFRTLMGAANFECSALSTPSEPQTAESCAIRLFQKEQMDELIAKHCAECEFARQKRLVPRSRHLITNYSRFFIDRLSLGMLAARTVTVFDEAHLLNDLFTDHCAIEFGDQSLMRATMEISEHLDMGSSTVFKILKQVRSDLLEGKIGLGTYMPYLHSLADAYGQVVEAAHRAADAAVRQPTKYLALRRLERKYMSLLGAIGDLLEHEYPHSFDVKAKDPKVRGSEHAVSIKPIFVGSMFETLLNAEFQLLMSATLTETYAKRTLELGDSHRHIRLAPTFPRENKRVVFYKPMTLNYASTKEPAVLAKLGATVAEIVDYHARRGERGAILAPSFALVQTAAKAIRDARLPVRLFEQERGGKLADVMREFIEYDGGPAVLLTPSGFEGLDLAGDLSRYQVLLKAPFGALGDARMRHIADNFPDIYKLTTLMKMVQGAGRSVRGPDDWATTYVTDYGAQGIWGGGLNDWRDEFDTRYSSTLERDDE